VVADDGGRIDHRLRFVNNVVVFVGEAYEGLLLDLTL